MKNKILFIILFLFAHNLYSQPNTKNDTTVVLKTDNYSNFKTPEQAYPYSGTFDIDSGGLKKGEGPGKLKMVSSDYDETIKQADKLFRKKQFQKAADLYILAFKVNNDLGQVKHRYNAGCCFAMLNKADSAFYQLYRIAEKGKYFNYREIEAEKYFKPLHDDKRWLPLIEIVKSNGKKLEDELNSKTPQQD